MATLANSKTYPSDTVFVHKITITEKKPLAKIAESESLIDSTAPIISETSFVRTKIIPSERSAIKLSKSININNNNGLKSNVDNGEIIKSSSVNLVENANVNNNLIKSVEDDSNSNEIKEKIDFSKIPKNTSDLKRETTYDGCPIYRVNRLNLLVFKLGCCLIFSILTKNYDLNLMYLSS